MTRTYLGVGLVTLATLLLELLLTRIFSVTLYYHFAFMVISLALFGIGVSGVVLYLKPERFPEEKLAELLSQYSRRFAVAIVLSLVFVVNHGVSDHLDATGVSRFSWQSAFQLTFLYLFAALPFYFGGMTVSLALFHLRRRVATLYFYDLAGASLACLLLDPLLGALGGPSAAIAAALCAALGALLFGRSLERFELERRSLLTLAGLAALLLVNLAWPVIEIGSVKDVRQELLTFSKWNSLSRIEVQELKGIPPSMTIDAMARTGIYSLKERNPLNEHQGISALVHAVRKGGRTLIIGPGGGVDVLAALRAAHREVVLAEINPIILNDVMLGRYRAYSGDLYAQPQVRPNVAEGRSFVRRSREQFDVIQATLVDTWAATAAGAFALTENHLYTVEAFEDYLRHLTPTGIATMSRWVGVRGMEFIRLGALARTALVRVGAREPHRHLFAASVERLGTLLVKRTPFSDAELAELRRFCAARRYQILYSPDGAPRNPVSLVLGPGDPTAFMRDFPVDVRPVYDDRPFFFYAVKPERVLSELRFRGPHALNNYSLVVLAALLGLVTVLTLAGIVIPLWLGKRAALAGHSRSKLRDLGYFLCLGVGFILLEIGLLSRFSLYLGHPTYSLRTVLFALLLASGLGSLLSGRARSGRALTIQLALAGAGVAGLGLLYALLLGRWLEATLALSLGARIAIAAGLTAAPGLLMGMMLPTGIRLLSDRHAEIVPWAWGLNGAASVLGSVIAMAVSLHLGFTVTLLVGASAYLLAVLLGLRRPA